MTEKYVPQVGDRVRFTAEGVVTRLRPEYADVRFDGEPVDDSISTGVGTWERLCDPLPTTPGSVIDWRGILCHLTRDGLWVDDDGSRYTPRSISLTYTVEHDAGSVKL